MVKKEIPILFLRKEECCGCGACEAICKQRAIRILIDEEGFKYPILDDMNCICCYMCLKVCPYKS